MKPNWLRRFHGYHTFADYLNFHSIILMLTKLCLFNYYNDTNFPWELNPNHIGSCPPQQGKCNKGVLHPRIAQLWNPPPNFQAAKPNAQTKLTRLLTYTILQLEHKPPKPKIKSRIQPDISLSLLVTSFHNTIASSYGKLDNAKKFLLNILTHKSKWVVSWFQSLFFMKERLLNVLSSSTDPNTSTIAISANLLYSLIFFTPNGKSSSIV